MIGSIYLHELNYWLKKPIIYVYFAVFFSFSLISFLGSGGYFDEPIKASETIRLLNSPHELNYLFQYIGKLFLFLIPAIIGTSIYKDFRYKVHSILYSYPFDKKAYLTGKFLASFSIVTLISFSAAFAFVIGEWLLGAANPKMGIFNGLAYLQAYFVFLLPNFFVFGVFVFTIVALSRSIYSGFIVVISLFLIQLITENAFQGNNFLIAISDPFGQNAVSFETQLWTLSEQNTKLIPFFGPVLYNRIFWFSTAILFTLSLFKAFTLSQNGFQVYFRKPKISQQSEQSKSKSLKTSQSEVEFDFSFKQQIKLSWKLSTFDFKFVVFSPMFIIFSALGILSVVLMLLRLTQNGELLMLPLTRLMLAIPAFFYITILILATFVYSGMIIHRASVSGMSALIDSSPINNGVLLFSKLIAIIRVQFLLLFLLMCTGIALQVSMGFFTIEIGQYLFFVFIVSGLMVIVWALISIFVHTLVPNLYGGIFILLLIWLGKSGFSQLGINSYLLQFNAAPQLIFSDLNGYGSQLPGYFLAQSYWLTFGFLTLFITYLFWKREFTFSIKNLLEMAKSRLSRSVQIGFLLFLVLFVSLGRMIYKAEQSEIGEKLTISRISAFETQFSPLKNLVQPRIKSIKLEVDLFPETNSFVVSGAYILVNESENLIDTLLLKTGFDEKTTYRLSEENKLLISDSLMKVFAHTLEKSLAPNDSIQLSFAIKNESNTLFERNSSVLNNGTFLKFDILPRLGFPFQKEKKNPADSTAPNNHYQAIDSDLIDVDVILSTNETQTVLASGVLQKEWKKDGRKFAQYKTEIPQKMGIAFNSGEYQVEKSTWNDVKLEIYHHESHKYTIKNMMLGLKAALEYNSSHFSPYPHKEVKIIEFPLSEGTYATLFGNTILTSEARFGVNTKEEDKIDLSFYVIAHELTHQWFGNSFLPKDVLGAVMLTESITEYITLKIYEQKFGKKRALQFLNKQRLRYLKGRTRETQIESLLYLVKAEQDYISYGKGALAFNAIANVLGETKLNEILQTFLIDFPSNEMKYPTTLDFLERLKRETPNEYQYLITDWFEKSVFYDLEIKEASLKEMGNTTEVSLDFTMKKQNGESEVLIINDLVEIGFYDENDTLIELKRVWVKEFENKMHFSLPIKPAKIVLDPNFLGIDKDVKNNVFSF